jgi:hypothetical protein
MKTFLISVAFILLTSFPAGALPVNNGGFDSGLDGWGSTVGVTWSGAAAQLRIQPYEAGITTMTLSQALTLPGPVLISFDVKFDNGPERVLPLGVDPGQPNFFQASFYSALAPSLDRFLVGIDVAGPYDAALNSLPGTGPDGWFHFAGIISGNGTLYFDLFDRGDIFWSEALVDNVQIASLPVPEPSTLVMLAAGLAVLVCFRRRAARVLHR